MSIKSLTPQSDRYRGYGEGKASRGLDIQGDAGWGVSKGATHLVHRWEWHENEHGRFRVLRSVPLRHS